MSLPRQQTAAETKAEMAWQAHKALVEAERRAPSLRENPAWRCLRDDAFETFLHAMGRLSS